MKLIIGLGNPGSKYSNTRHNLGFMALDFWCKTKNIEFNLKKHNSYYYQDKKLILVKPQTYINQSGLAIKKFIKMHKIDLKDLLVIHDDADYELGDFKLKSSGSSGGHNGIANIIEVLNSQDFPRLRIGISRSKNLEQHVLEEFSSEDKIKLKEILPQINQKIDSILKK